MKCAWDNWRFGGALLPLAAAKEISLIEPTAGAVRGTLLLIGSGVLAESLAKGLAGKGAALERATSARAAASASALSPALVVLAGDAAQHRGTAVLAQLTQANSALFPVLVICAPQLDSSLAQPAPRHVGYLAPEGGVSECARRICTILELLVEEGLVANTLQQLTTTASARTKPAADAMASPARNKPLAAAPPRIPQPAAASASTRLAPVAPAPAPKSSALRSGVETTGKPASAELEVFVSFSEPPPSATAHRGEAPSAQLSREALQAVHEPPTRDAPPALEARHAALPVDPNEPTQGAAPARKPRRAASPLDPVALPVQESTHDAVPAARRAASPLDPVALPARSSKRRATLAQDNAAASGAARQQALRRADAPLLASSLSHEPASLSDLSGTPDGGAKRRRTLALALCALAAACGAAVLLYARGDGSAESAHATAATGALHQAPSAQPAPVADVSDRVAAAEAPRGASPSETSGPGQSAQPAAQERPAGVGRRTEQEGEPAPTSELGRAQALVNEGIALSRQRRFGLAEGLYLKALQVVPDYPNAMAELVRVHLARRDGVEAIRWANRLIDAQPNNGVNQLLLGDAQALRGDQEAARTTWTKAARSGNVTARKRLAEE